MNRTRLNHGPRGLAPALLLWAVTAAGCGATEAPAPETETKTTSVQALLASTQCAAPSTRPTLAWIDSDAELATTFADLRPGAPIPDVDLDRRRILRIDMGMRPTAGYGLGLADQPARLLGEDLMLIAEWRSPPAGAMLAQVLTSPCLLVELPRQGYRRVRVLDTGGTERATLENR